MDHRKEVIDAPFMTYAEASRLLGVRTGTLYAWVHRRAIPHVRLSRRVVRFRRADIESWMRERTITAEMRPQEPVNGA